MAIADLTPDQLAIVERVAVKARKHLARAIVEAFEEISSNLEGTLDDPNNAATLAGMGAKLDNNAEEILNVKVATLKRFVQKNFPTDQQVWNAIKDIF